MEEDQDDTDRLGVCLRVGCCEWIIFVVTVVSHLSNVLAKRFRRGGEMMMVMR